MDILLVGLIAIISGVLLCHCWKKEKATVFFILLLSVFMLAGGWLPAILDSQKEVLLPDGGSFSKVITAFSVGAVVAAILYAAIKPKLFKNNTTEH